MKIKFKRLFDVLRNFGVTRYNLFTMGFWIGFAFYYGMNFAIFILKVVTGLL